MGNNYNEGQLRKLYGMFCKSVDECISTLRSSEISDDFRHLLERRVKVTFLMADYSLSVLEGIKDSLLDEVRGGIDKRRFDWGYYRSSTFNVSPGRINRVYDECWAEEERFV